MGNSFVDSLPAIKRALLGSELAIFESVDQDTFTAKVILNREESYEYREAFRKKYVQKLEMLSKS